MDKLTPLENQRLRKITPNHMRKLEGLIERR